MKRTLGRLQWVPMVVSLAVAAVAIAQELAKPPGQRTWHGQVLGFIPYDLRPPTVERLRASVWNPDDPQLITGQVFGVGWSINFYRVAERLGEVTKSRRRNA
jgi:hypothetical protein